METKLTLKLDKLLIEKAKEYAISHNKSLSTIIESYLRSLTYSEKTSINEEIQISAFVKSMSAGLRIPSDLNYKAEYASFQTEKYK